MKFNKVFVDNLKLLIPKNVQEFELKYPKNQNGYARFNDDNLESIYLESLEDKYGNNIILKFNYAKETYLFSDIYICGDNCNEYRYDKNLELNAVYLKGISIPAKESNDLKLHMLEVLVEWQEFSTVLGKKDYISTYQIEKDGKKVKNPYIVLSEKLKNPSKFDLMKSIIQDFNINNVKYFRKCTLLNKTSFDKEKIIYLIIDYKTKTTNDR